MTLIGNVGKNPEFRAFNNVPDTPDAKKGTWNFSLATSKAGTDAQGQLTSSTTWHLVSTTNERYGEKVTVG